MLERRRHLVQLRRLLRERPVVALLGARRAGKTTLAREIAKEWGERATILDLESPRDRARLEDAMLALEGLRGLVVLDEVHHRPDLFPVLRVLADRPRTPARFLVLGSASPARSSASSAQGVKSASSGRRTQAASSTWSSFAATVGSVSNSSGPCRHGSPRR